MRHLLPLLLLFLAVHPFALAEDRVVPQADLPKPGYLESYTDPAFGSKVTRITGDVGELIPSLDARWNEVARQGYSKDSAWNWDQSLLLLKRHHGFPSMLFLDGRTYEPLFGRNLGPGSETRWLPGKPDHMLYVKDQTIGLWNVREDSTEVVATFPGYSDFHLGPWEGNLSHDGNRLAISATKAGVPVVFAYDVAEKKKYPDLSPTLRRLDWVTISASGNYLVINGHFTGEQGDQSQVYTLEGEPVGPLWEEYGRPSHYDLAIDENGQDIAVGVSKSRPDDGRVIKRQLSDGKVTVLTSGGYAGHTSCRNLQRPGWAYVTYQHQGPDWGPYWDEVLAVKLDGSLTVERFAHLRSLRTDYLTEAHVVPSPDGLRVLWASAWKSATGRPISAYVAEQKEEAP